MKERFPIYHLLFVSDSPDFSTKVKLKAIFGKACNSAAITNGFDPLIISVS